ncbi:DNA-directed RNA polymerase III complex subunit Rpc25 [Rhizoctonia solani]
MPPCVSPEVIQTPPRVIQTTKASFHGMVFPVDGERPKLIPVNLLGMVHEGGVVDWQPVLAPILGADAEIASMIISTGVGGEPLRFPLQVFFRSNFLADGSRRNHTVESLTYGKARHDWKGPIVALKYSGTRLSGYANITMADLPSLDNVSVAPSQFSSPAHVAITNELNKKYANRVLLDIGLCICVFDLIWVGEGVVKYGDGCYWYKVTFRMVVFRPARSEVIIGKVKSSTEDGIRAIFVADEPPSTTQLLDTDITTRLYLDRNEVIRLRVERDEFYENEPGPRKPDIGQPGQEDRVEDDADRKAPYTITGSVHGDGLGALVWWENTEQDVMEE